MRTLIRKIAKLSAITLLASPVFAQNPDFTVSVQVQKITCADSSNGYLYLNPTGGVAPYTITWSTGIVSKELYNVGPGVYQATIEDAVGSTLNVTIPMTAPDPISIVSDITNVTSVGGTYGEIELALSGGVGTMYEVLWNTGEITSHIANLSAGTYDVIVTDENGCVESQSFQVNTSLAPVINQVYNQGFTVTGASSSN